MSTPQSFASIVRELINLMEAALRLAELLPTVVGGISALAAVLAAWAAWSAVAQGRRIDERRQRSQLAELAKRVVVERDTALGLIERLERELEDLFVFSGRTSSSIRNKKLELLTTDKKDLMELGRHAQRVLGERCLLDTLAPHQLSSRSVQLLADVAALEVRRLLLTDELRNIRVQNEQYRSGVIGRLPRPGA